MIEQMDRSVSDILKVFSLHHSVVGKQEYAPKNEGKKAIYATLIPIIIINGIASRTKH